MSTDLREIGVKKSDRFWEGNGNDKEMDISNIFSWDTQEYYANGK